MKNCIVNDLFSPLKIASQLTLCIFFFSYSILRYLPSNNIVIIPEGTSVLTLTDYYHEEIILVTFILLCVGLQRLEIWPDCSRWI